MAVRNKKSIARKKQPGRVLAKAPLRLSGVAHDFEANVLDDPDFRISDAIVTQTKIALDWTDEDEPYCIVAKSTDNGVTYKGHVGFPELATNCPATIRRFTAVDGTELLFTSWYRTDLARAGFYIIELSRKR